MVQERILGVVVVATPVVLPKENVVMTAIAVMKMKFILFVTWKGRFTWMGRTIRVRIVISESLKPSLTMIS